MRGLAHRIAVALDGWADTVAEYQKVAEVEQAIGEIDVKAYEVYEDAKLAFADDAAAMLAEARPILGALEWLLETWDRYTVTDLGPHLTCGETEALADLLRAAGRPAQAEALVDGHAESDAEGDQHYRGGAS